MIRAGDALQALRLPRPAAPRKGPGGLPLFVALSATGEVGRVVEVRAGRARVQFETWEGPQRTLRFAERWIPLKRLRPA